MSGEDSKVTGGNQLSLENQDAEIQEVKNENVLSFNHQFDDFSKIVHVGKQGKHIPGHNNFKQGNSEITLSLNELQALVNFYSGKGSVVSGTRERVDFGRTIGVYVDEISGERKPTQIGIIHYSNSGCHVIPARPKRKDK